MPAFSRRPAAASSSHRCQGPEQGDLVEEDSPSFAGDAARWTSAQRILFRESVEPRDQIDVEQFVRERLRRGGSPLRRENTGSDRAGDGHGRAGQAPVEQRQLRVDARHRPVRPAVARMRSGMPLVRTM